MLKLDKKNSLITSISPEFYSLIGRGQPSNKSQLAGWEFAILQHSAVPQGFLVCLVT
jgi:hypothetical protein